MKNEKILLKTVASGQVAYFDQGQGPILLFLHGFPDTPYSFQDQVSYFTAKGYRCLVPFMPGYGETSLPRSGSSSMLAIATMLDEWLEELVKGQSIAIYGHDWGSIVAQVLVALAGERDQSPYEIEKLVIGAVPPMAAFMKNVSFRQLYRSRYMAYFQLPRVINKIQTDGLDYVRELWERWSPDLNYPNQHCEDTIALLKQGSGLSNGISYYRHMFNPLFIFRGGSQPIRQMRLLLKKQALPCLMVVGENDECIGLEVFEGGESSYPHANTRTVKVSGAGHFVHFEKPEQFSRSVEAFLTEA
ncbi:MAG: hypothetical protein COB04_06025 [Gammaproteobacteria bacterium]|nr:MAG: hypothetical protein COB04_06025 [Gammaproteobacteria bacterium]